MSRGSRIKSPPTRISRIPIIRTRRPSNPIQAIKSRMMAGRINSSQAVDSSRTSRKTTTSKSSQQSGGQQQQGQPQQGGKANGSDQAKPQDGSGGQQGGASGSNSAGPPQDASPMNSGSQGAAGSQGNSGGQPSGDSQNRGGQPGEPEGNAPGQARGAGGSQGKADDGRAIEEIFKDLEEARRAASERRTVSACPGWPSGQRGPAWRSERKAARQRPAESGQQCSGPTAERFGRPKQRYTRSKSW